MLKTVMQRNSTQTQSKHELDIFIEAMQKFLVELVYTSYLSTMNCTKHSAIVEKATLMYFTMVRHLRDLLRPEGWFPLNENGTEVTYNQNFIFNSQKHTSCLIVKQGNKSTGIETEFPSNKNKFGKNILPYVEENKKCFSNFESLPPSQLSLFTSNNSDDQKSNTIIILLLYYVDKKASEIRFELLIPTEVETRYRKNNLSSQYFISECKIRYIFDPISLDDWKGLNLNSPQPPEPEIDVPVYKRK
jgi:hypothetical protein